VPDTKPVAETVRILLVDDHPLVRKGLGDVIAGQAGLEVCGEADDLATALAAFKQHGPDLVVADLKLQGDSGLDLIRQIRRESKSVKILVCSMYEESSFAERALRAGASGYVSKHESGSTILEAIRAVVAGEMYISGALKDEIVRRLLNVPADKADSPLHALSDREMQVFEMIGSGQSIREIADHLHISHRTVETYRDGIKNKLSLESSRDVVRYATQWMQDQG
jgi:DNA-binding NarL/FixJ family response regulator